MSRINFKINGKEFSGPLVNRRLGATTSERSERGGGYGWFTLCQLLVESRGTLLGMFVDFKRSLRIPAGEETISDEMLVDYIRKRASLFGTKFMCREGGCGACIVNVVPGPGKTPRSVNSCLVPVLSCQDWEITTIEKVGNRGDGYHEIQKKFAEENATQCGYCTPGWVMAVYSLLKSRKDLTMLDLEKSVSSNICRCTGYRPILKVLSYLGTDSPKSLLADIEDLRICEKTNKICNKTCEDDDWCFVPKNLTQNSVIKLNLKDGKKWFRVYTISDIFDILKTKGSDIDYSFVAGNTEIGPFPRLENPPIIIDISNVSELEGHKFDQNLIINANTRLTEFIDILDNGSKEDNFAYLKKVEEHIMKVAHYPVRNVGTIAGNLMIKHKHPSFTSDVFLLLETVGAYVTILDAQGSKQAVSMADFLKTDMKEKILYNIMMPPLTNDKHELRSYKIMPRAQSTHAMVNAGFLWEMNKSDNTVLNSRIVFSGLVPPFTRASKTEAYLKGKPLFENDTLQSALKILEQELVATEDPPAPSAAYRKQLALGLFYKGLITLCPTDKLAAQYRSGVIDLHETRPLSTASQEYKTDKNVYPLNKEIPKVEALIQAAGEAKYVDDLPTTPDEVYGALVLSTVGKGTIKSIDASEALKLPGVIAFYSAKDIPGKNSFMEFGVIVQVGDEEIFCSEKVKYYNQPLGIIVADTSPQAERAAKLVKVEYADVSQPLIDIKEARKDTSRNSLFITLPAVGRGLAVDKTFKSNYTIYGQTHFCMENIKCVARPSEQGLEVYSTTQWIDGVRFTVARALKIDENSVDVYVPRLGGAYGIKISRASLSAIACSLAAYNLNKPVRLIPPMSTTTRSLGKRLPCSADVEAGVSKTGVIQYASTKLYQDNGHAVTEIISILGLDACANVYNKLWWGYTCYNSTTDTPKNTYCRAPGSLENVAMAEHLVEQISYEVSMDPYEVRMNNLDKILSGTVKEMAETLKTKAEYDKRRAEVDKFNAENRWKKRGIRCSLMKYTPLCPAGYEVNISICHGDGTIVINHGGIEMGQGINTKCVQIAAYFLKIPVEKIKVKGHNSITSPNSIFSGASLTSQSVGIGVERCCKELMLRLAPVRLLLPLAPWEVVIKTAYNMGIDLQARTMVNYLLSPIFIVHGVAFAEVECDILTGEIEIKRVDLMEDVGRSINPNIDIGQVEGAFIMGLGYWTCEHLVFDKDTGELQTDRPWDYYVPQARDIPQEFHVYFKENSFSSEIVLGSKVTGEPATCLAVCVAFAIRHAISAARKDSGIPTNQWFDNDGPFTAERVCMLSATKIEQFKYN